MNRRLTAWIVTIAFLPAVAGLAADPQTNDPAATIREFDISTIEKLGQEMYRQDQEAWKATDLLMAEHSMEELTAQHQKGWIVVSAGATDTVKFIRDGNNGPEATYEVTFGDGTAAKLKNTGAVALTADELALYRARSLAITNIDHACSEHFNTIVLKDPQGSGWLVWVLTSTTDPDAVIIGGHYRFTISADGKSIVRRDALSRSCLAFSRKDIEKQGTPAGLFVTHIVSSTPVETHVFANLSYGLTLYVGTDDKRVWKLENGHIQQLRQN